MGRGWGAGGGGGIPIFGGQQDKFWQRKYSAGALVNICHSGTPDKDSFNRVTKFYKIDGEILEAEQKMYAEFS